MDERVVEQLKNILDQAQALMDEQPTNLRDILDDKRLGILQRLVDECIGCEDVQEKELRSLQKKRKRTVQATLGGPRDPWKRITNLESLPGLPDHVEAHIRKYPGVDHAEKFLRVLSLASNCGQYNSQDNLGDAFMARYTWTQQVERRDEQVHILQLSNDLFWFDIMQLLRPQGTGRVGDVMRDELDKFLTPLDVEGMGLDKEKVIDKVGTWSIRGAKLNKLCNSWSAGVILVLHKELSRNFLEDKFTASGPYFEGAVSRLTELGLKEYIERTGAGVLGDAIRELMIKPFRLAHVQQLQKRT